MARKTVLSDEKDEMEVKEDSVDYVDRKYEDADEDEEGEDEYENDGFILDDLDEEEAQEEDNANSDEEKQRKKKRKKKELEKNYVLDEDDYELLQDSKDLVLDEDDYELLQDSDEEKQRTKKRKKKEPENNFVFDEDDYQLLLDNNVFDEGPSRFSDEDDYDRTGNGPPTDDIAEEEEDEMADFIVDEELDEHDEPTMQEVHDMFGDVDELLLQRELVLEHDNNGRRLEDEFEPIILSEKYMTQSDDRIREIDIPERMQI